MSDFDKEARDFREAFAQRVEQLDLNLTRQSNGEYAICTADNPGTDIEAVLTAQGLGYESWGAGYYFVTAERTAPMAVESGLAAQRPVLEGPWQSIH